MPFSEKKGRFTVSITEQPRPPSPTPSLSEAPPAGSPGSSGVNRAVKRGRFLVSCLPCSSSPCLAPTLSLQAEEVGLLSQDSLKVVNTACASRSTCSSDETRVTTMEHSSAAAEVTSPCQDTCPATAAAMAAAGQGGAPAQSPELRRVRFSETAEDLTPCTLAQQQAESSTAQKRHQQQQPEPPRQLKHTRSYCSGRFMIQEAVSVAAGGLYRSKSAPEVAGSMSSSMSSCSSLQATYGPFAAPLCSYGRSGSPDSSIDGSCGRPGNTASSCADLAAANELMSCFMQQHQHSSQQQQQHAVLGYPSHGLPCPAGHHAAAAAAGGLFAFASVPLPNTLGSASSEEEGSFVSSLLSSSDIASDAGHPLLMHGTPMPGSSAASSRHSSGRRCASNSSSSANLLGSCYSGSTELMSAAAAAALGHHYQGPLGRAHSHVGHQHIAPKRSASMTYFRRGRFLVQTTMN